MNEFLITKNREKISPNFAHSILSNIYGGPIIPCEKINDKTTEFKEYKRGTNILKYKFTISERDDNVIIEGGLPVKVINKLRDYNLVLKRI